MTAVESPWPPQAFYFTVIFGNGSDTSFQEVSGIAPEIETDDVFEGGENRFAYHLPKAKRHPRLVLKRGVATADSPLVQWCKRVLEGDFSQPFETAQIDVRLLNDDGAPIASWSFAEAFPVRWEIDGFGSMKNEIAIERVEFSYYYSTREK